MTSFDKLAKKNAATNVTKQTSLQLSNQNKNKLLSGGTANSKLALLLLLRSQM